MRNKISRTLLVAALALGAAKAGHAASATANGTVTANVNAVANLTLSSNNLTFASADPTVTPNISPNEGAISVTAKARTSAGADVTLTVKAADDLKSGANVIGIDQVSWTASGSGFGPGTMSKATDQAVGLWTNSGQHSGTLNFLFANSYNYATGTYTAAITYTLTAP